mgnify:CR=1 FL=1
MWIKLKIKKVSNKLAVSEHQIQSVCIQWARLMAKSNDKFKMIYAVPNGGKRSRSSGAKFRREGLTKGVFDVMVDVPMRGFHGMRLEFKTEKGKLSEEQKNMQALYLKFGYVTSIIRNFNQFRSVIEAYFYEPKKFGEDRED